MASFTVDISYTIISTELSTDESAIAVTYDLTCSAADLTTRYEEAYPTSVYFQNVDDTMDESDLQTQMRANFLLVSKTTMEDFAREAKAKIQNTQGLIGNEDLSGVISLSEEIIINYKTANIFTVSWE
jgi:hypothetical protein